MTAHRTPFLPKFATILVVAFLMAGAAHGQSRSSANRYRMMLRQLEVGDTMQAAAQEKAAAAERERTASADALEGTVDPTQYLLGPGDELLLTIIGREFTSMNLLVMSEGDVLLPNTGHILMAGKTLAQAESLVVKTLTPLYREATFNLALSKMRRFRVYLAGWVERHDAMLATPVDRVSTMIERAGGFTKKTVANPLMSAYIRRIPVHHRDNTTTFVDLYPYYFYGDLSCNPYVRDGDVIYVTVSSPSNMVSIYGEVGWPGDFQYGERDSLSTLIDLAQGFLPSAYLDSIEVSRFNADGTSSERFYVNGTGIASVVSGGRASAGASNFALQRGDQVFVREKPKWHLSRTIVLAGELKYPGRYPIRKDSARLTEVISRAGGFTDEAAIEDAEIIRKSGTAMIDREFERLLKMIPSEMTKEEYEYFKAKSRERPGVMVVDFKRLFVQKDLSEDIFLREDDSIYVPAARNYVSIIGRVNTPGRILFDPSMKFDGYIVKAGGYGFRADESGARIIKTRTGEMFDPRKTSKYTLEPGDTIFIPEEPETNLWPAVITAITITAQLAGVLFGVYAISRAK